MKAPLSIVFAVLSLLSNTCWSAATAGQGEIEPRTVEATESRAFSPDRVDATDERIAQLKLPEGFRINVFARDLGHARMLCVAEDGTVYLTRPRQNRVTRLRDVDGDGRADEVETAIGGLEDVHGIALHGDTMYLAAPRIVWTCKVAADGSLSKPNDIITDLPGGGGHDDRTLAVRDDRLFITVGSTCNACKEAYAENATILTAALDGSTRTIFATGLRNTIGFGWHPQTGQMWGMDHGSDNRGNDLPPEELNRLEEGKDYGWPYAFGKRVIDPLMDPPPGMTKAEYARRSMPSVLEYQAHSSPIGMTFYSGQMFPERYRNGAFVCFRGSWNRDPATGYKVVFIPFAEGQPQGFEDFVTGFLINDGQQHFGRLSGIAQARDGSLLFADDTNGMLYRVSYGSRSGL